MKVKGPNQNRIEHDEERQRSDGAPRLRDSPVNRLLGLLPPRITRVCARIFAVYRSEYRQSLYRAHQPIGFVYFIETGVGSLVNTMANGQASEVGTIGNEGLVGLPIVFGDDRAPTSVYIQVPGAGLRMKAALFKKELARSASMQNRDAALCPRLLRPGRAVRASVSSFPRAALLPLAADDARPHAIRGVSAHAGSWP